MAINQVCRAPTGHGIYFGPQPRASLRFALGLFLQPFRLPKFEAAQILSCARPRLRRANFLVRVARFPEAFPTLCRSER